MKRLLLGLGCVLGLTPGGLFAQDATPAARLGNPAAALGRPVHDPDIIRAQAPSDGTPKPMPKGGVADVPSKSDLPVLPAPGPMLPGTINSGPPIILPPGGMVVPPVLSDGLPPGAVYGPPIPGGPMLGDPQMPCPVPGANNTCGWYTSVEALVWWVKSYSAPALASVGPPGSAAALTSTGTSVLFGVNSVDTNPRYGARITLGYWLSPQWAVEVSAFYLRPDRDRQRFLSADFPNQDFGRPFFSLNRHVETSQLIGRPGVVSGYVQFDSESDFYGGELNCRHRLCDWCDNHLDVLFGYRYVYLREELLINEQARALAGAGNLAGIERAVTDKFQTKNQFNGGQVGAIFQHTHGPWTIDVTGKVALGMTWQRVEIGGSVTPIGGGVPPNLPGGLLALNSNIGVQKRQTFAVIPEIGLNVGYDVTSRLRLFAGGTFLYWSNVARPGAQIDRTLDEARIPDFTLLSRTPIPTAASVRPVNQVNSESFWATGFNFGLLYRW
ncbi:MAG TPA: BBP7 family outer membrane beta-barrel protein [Gemmataceae bacterium]|nr:BBP7 family outer membrane beta-barrel protein [Gemmataceae bacterium]